MRDWIGFVALLAVLLGGCSSGVPPVSSTATAVAIEVATAEQRVGSMAATAQAQAGAIAQTAAAQHTTATAVARASAEAVATAVARGATAEALALYPDGKEIFRDEFVDNRNFWFTGVFQEVETDLIEDGVFKVRWAAKGTSYELWESQELSDFAAEVQCRIAVGGTNGSCALVFNQANEVGFYKFEVFADYYRLALIVDGSEPLVLAEGRPAAGFDVSEPFVLRVVRRDSAIRIALDDQPLAHVNDTTFLSGKVGVSTSSYQEDGGVEVYFDNFVIWQL